MNKEYKKLRKQLTKENRKVFTQIELYLSNNNIKEKIYKEKLNEILLKALEAQNQGLLIEDVVGYDYINFCKEFIKNSSKRSLLEWIINFLYKIINYLGIFLIISVLIDYNNIFIDKYDISLNIPYFINLIIYAVCMEFINTFKYKVFFIDRKNIGVLVVLISILVSLLCVYFNEIFLAKEYVLKINIFILLIIFGINLLLYKLKSIYF